MKYNHHSRNFASASPASRGSTLRRPRSELLRIAAASALALAALAGCGGGGDSNSSSNDMQPAPPVPAPTPEIPRTTVKLAGELEYGQTSVVRQNETRIAPRLVEGRSTLLLFTPTNPISKDQKVFVEATLNGVSMGRLLLRKPAGLAGYAEDRITQDTLPRYSTQTWSTQMPTGWMKADVQLTLGYDELRPEENRIYAYRVTSGLPPLAAPSELTYTRTKTLFWEDADSNADTVDADKLADEIHARMPVSRISIVDYLPARWNSVILMGPPRRFDSLGQIPHGVTPTTYSAWAASDMVNKANTGRGMLATSLFDMYDKSPLAYGATLSQGRYKDIDGNLQTAFGNDFSYSGWAQMPWNVECHPLMNIALGRVLGLFPSTQGEPSEFGSEYPDGLVWAASHPQPFDTARGVFRTWYAATDGFTMRSSGKPPRGRIDPLFYGASEPSDSQSCFSPYTNYNTRAIQRRLDSTPTLRTVAGSPGYYRWDNTNRTYTPVTPDWAGAALQLKPDRMGVPVVTVIGSLTSTENPGASMLFPPLFAASGNTFVMEEVGTTSSGYSGARFAARVSYADGKHRLFIIPKDIPIKERTYAGIASREQAFYFSFNLPIADKPVEVSLYRLDQPYTARDFLALTSVDKLLSTRAITIPTSMPAPVTRGGDSLQESRTAMVSKLCTTQTCETESIDIAWHPDDESQLYFVAGRPSLGQTTPVGNPKGAPMRLEVPMNGPDGNQRVVVFRASRTVNTASAGYRLSPANYWRAPELLKDKLQRLDIWVHADDNTALPAGRYTMKDAVKLLDVHAVSGAGDTIVDRVKLNATFEKL